VELCLGFFELIGEKILWVFDDSRKNGRIHGPINSTFITLIPKVDDPQSFDYFKHISMCNFIYEIVAKIIAMHL